MLSTKFLTSRVIKDYSGAFASITVLKEDYRRNCQSMKSIKFI